MLIGNKKGHTTELLAEVTIIDKNGKTKISDSFDATPETEGNIKLTVSNPDGTIDSVQEVPFDSFLSNFTNLQNYALAGVTNSSLLKLTSGSNPSGDLFTIDCEAAATTDTHGIFVGTNVVGGASPGGGPTAQYGDYNLRSKIAHGTSAGQLEYGACTLNTYTLGDTSFTFTRTFLNSSGGTIVVKETGLVGANSTDYLMICRDTYTNISSPAAINTTVGNGQTLTVTYTIPHNFSTSTGGFNANYLSWLVSLLTGSATNVIATTTGAATSTDFSADVTYSAANPAAATETHGLLVANYTGAGVDDFFDATARFLQNQDTELTHSAHTTFASETFTQGINGYPAGYTQFHLQRDFTNSTGTARVIDRGALVVAGDSVKAMILMFKLPQTYNVGNLETLRLKITIRNLIGFFGT